MKRQVTKYRFYLWDYLWWAGERLHDYHPQITGNDMLQMYFTFLVYFPLLMLFAYSKPAFVKPVFFLYLLALYLGITIAWWIWNKKIYAVRRRKAVMRHYSKVRFIPAIGFLLFFMPVIFFISVTMTICSLMD